MRLAGSILMALGLLIGLSLTAFLAMGAGALGLTWLASIAVGKLAFVSSLGLMGSGATLHRLERKRKDRKLLETSTQDEPKGRS